MKRTCCSSANAYDAGSAIYTTFAQNVTGTGIKRRLSTIRGSSVVLGGPWIHTPASVRRRFSTPGGCLRDGKANTASHGSTSSSLGHKLDLYESMIAQQHSSPKQPPSKSARRLHGTSKSVQHVTATHWKIEMSMLSQFIRENRSAVVLGTPDLKASDGRRVDFDYTPCIIDPKQSTTKFPKSIPWAASADMRRESSASETLDFEIKNFGKFMAPTRGEKKTRYLLAGLLRTIVMGVFDARSARAYAFGSYNNDTVLPFSDLDVGICRTSLPPQHEDESTARGIPEGMRDLFNKFRGRDDFMLALYREHPFPTITAQHKETGIDVQLVAKPTSGQDSFIMGYKKRIPNLWPLYAIVRTMFGIRGLVDPFVGGISAYGSFMMLVAALTRRGTPVEIHESPSAQLLAFLDFWATFDTTKFGMAISTSIDGASIPIKKRAFDFTSDSARDEYKSLTRAARRREAPFREGRYRLGRVRPLQPYMLCLQDPNDADNDLGSSCHAIKHILETIKHLRTKLLTSMEEHDRTPEGEVPGKKAEFSFLLPLVGRCHEVYAEQRERIGSGFRRPHGRHEPLQRAKRVKTEEDMPARRLHKSRYIVR